MAVSKGKPDANGDSVVTVESVEFIELDSSVEVFDIEIPEDDSFQASGIVLHNSKHCASIDGRRHKVGTNHPKPPYHPNCRTIQAPAIDGDLIGSRPYVRALKVKKRDGSDRFRAIGDMTKKQREEAGLEVGQVKATTNYGSWLKSQDAEFQRQWLGKTRYELFSKGEYTLDRFLDPTGRQYTIDQLRERDAETFRQIFGE